MTTTPDMTFSEFGLSPELISVLHEVGYEQPSPIQSLTIPHLLSGRDVLGQAQTGTGKTAAFALPILSRLDHQERAPQVLVLAPTRELAIQVAEAFQKYAAKLPRFTVLPIYGGQDYSVQLKGLKRGVQVVVGTPGRVMDHIRRGTLKLEQIKTLVLDEADEMLRMGFLEDVEWVLSRLPEKRQIALFSATMPREVKKIAETYLIDPQVIRVESKTTTADTVRQRYWSVRKIHKLDALTRMLEAETFDGAIIFVRTKLATLELAEKLKARGFAAEALNGDIVQKQREKTVAQLKKGSLDILVATDVAARGLDVERITHVINYDVPFDTESYVHRIGRTGRAGRKGDAILFVSPREQRMLRAIERATNTRIEPMDLPSKADVARKRKDAFKRRLAEALQEDGLEVYSEVVQEFVYENEISIEEVAAALAKLSQGERRLALEESIEVEVVEEKPFRKKFRKDRKYSSDKPSGKNGKKSYKAKDKSKDKPKSGGKSYSAGGGKKNPSKGAKSYAGQAGKKKRPRRGASVANS